VTGHSLHLRPAASADLAHLDPWFDDPQTQQWLGRRGWVEQALRLAATTDARHSLVAERDGEPVAFLDVDVVQGCAGIGIVVSPAHRRHGMGADALRAVCTDPRFTDVAVWQAGIEHGNAVSARTFAAAGFVPATGTPTSQVVSQGFDYVELPTVVAHARSLLGRVLNGHGVAARITEVEAYGGVDDPASHAFTRTPRSEIMYGPPWHLYVYRSYGIHFCANIVTGPTDKAAAVLVRAGEIVDGIEMARERRGRPVKDAALARGPGNLARALGLSVLDLGADLLQQTGVRIGPPPEVTPGISTGPRVGVSKAADVPWRFWIVGDPTVSAYRRSPRA